MDKISTPDANIFLTEGNLVRIEINHNAELDVNSIEAINNSKFKLVGENYYTVLFIPGMETSISREAREFSARNEVNKNAIAKAIIVKNFSHRLLGNFFIKINNPPVPTSLFSSEEEAINWLRRMTVASLKKQ